MSIKLGVRYKDIYTEFEGVAIAYTQYITGSDRVVLQPGLQADGSLQTCESFDVERLIPATEKVIQILPKPIKKQVKHDRT